MDVDEHHPIPFVLGSAAKYLAMSAVALTLYDYMLLFDDEIRYVWKGRKTWIFCLYILNRMLLVGYQLWQIYHIANADNPKILQVAYYLQLTIIMVFLFFSDIFITLRIHAISLGNKILVVYFAVLAVARLVMAFATAFINSPAVATNLEFKLIPNTIGTTFELSAFLVVVWYTYRNRGTLKLSALLRTLVAEATVYFLVMVAAQIFVQLSFNLIKGQQLSLLAYGLFNPILTLRFAISLRKSADPEGRKKWQLAHFSSPHFAGAVSLDIRVSAARENIEMGLVNPSYGRVQLWEP